MIAVVVVLLCLSTTMVGLRILCRSLIKGFGLDDLAAVLTLVSSQRLTIAFFCMLTHLDLYHWMWRRNDRKYVALIFYPLP